MMMMAMVILSLSLLWLIIPLLRYKQLKLAVFLSAGVSGIFVFCYTIWGHGEQLNRWQGAIKKQQSLTAEFRKLGTPDEITTKLKEQLQNQPSDSQGWFLLGKLYYTGQHYAEARDALEKAYALNPNNPALCLQYAQALLFADGDAAQDVAEQLLRTTLKVERNNITALNLLGLIFLSQQRYSEALTQWQKIVTILPQDDPAAKEYQLAIDKLSHQKPLNPGISGPS